MSDTAQLLLETALLFDDRDEQRLPGFRSTMREQALILAEMIRQCEDVATLGDREMAFCRQVEASSSNSTGRRDILPALDIGLMGRTRVDESHWTVHQAEH